jgi:hypothetical protein
MTDLRIVGRDGERALCVVEADNVPHLQLVVPAELKPFVMFSAFDARDATDDDLARFALRVLEQGCAYVCAWGEKAGRVELAFDRVAVDAQLAGRPYVPDVLMTTSHEDESLDDALWFAVVTAFPPALDAHAVVAICDQGLSADVEMRLSDSERWNEELLRQDEEAGL